MTFKVPVSALSGCVLALCLSTGLASGNASEERTAAAIAKEQSRRDEFLRNIPVPVRIPGEFGKLSAVLLSSNDVVYTEPELFARLVDVISPRAPVVAVVSGAAELLAGREALEDGGVDRSRVHFLVHKLDTMWIRDYGPVFMRRSDGSGSIIDTYYGAKDKGEGRVLDDRFPWIMANLLDRTSAYVPLAMEGGNFLTNGQGIAVSSTTLLDRNRFRNLEEDEFHRLMSTYFCLRSLVLVPPLPSEPTGHVDMFISFVGPRDVVVAKALPGEDPAIARVLDQAAEQLSEQSMDGIPLVVSRIPFPPRLGKYWRSYTNVFMVNGLLLMPSYSDVDPAIEQEVVDTYQRLLPAWEIQKIPSDTLVEFGGFLHCMTIGVPHFIDPAKMLELID